KSRFFTNISHEFRTPLTLILGPVEKILNSVKDKAIASDLGLVQRNARRLQKLINQLLSLSKLESGKLELHAQETDAIPLVKGYVQSFESLAKQKGIELIIEADQNNIKAWLDREKIEAILNNLFSNAFKFTHGGGRIEVQVGSRESADNNLMDKERIKDWLEICIHDTGNGIPQDKLPHIFDRFYQANDNYSKDQEGTGIGLALTRELVELHHGKIFVESKLGTGTMFTVVLPLGKNHLKEEEITTDQQLAVDILQPDPRPEDEPEGASGCQCLKYVDRFLTNVNPKNGNNFRIQKNLRSKKIT
ncbi:MAG: HAMP domain-containing histidine kinase, partial [Bacteroidales bacterium]|nr:HAMP domain-containing histidine kinase [Bacteroidales bacterium]